MKMNFKGLVDLHTLPKTTPLLPLYEAIINSIQSIEDAQISNGKVEIIVERDKQMNLFNQWETDIENIIIVDNGIGFDDENYNSFDTYASEYKIQNRRKGNCCRKESNDCGYGYAGRSGRRKKVPVKRLADAERGKCGAVD